MSAARDILKNYNVLWLDRDINESTNDEYKKALESYFSEIIPIKESKYVESQIAQSIRPVVVISSGSLYEEIKELVESTGWVVGITIYCYDTKKYEQHHRACPKVCPPRNTFKDILRDCENIHPDRIRALRFHGSRDEEMILKPDQLSRIELALLDAKDIGQPANTLKLVQSAIRKLKDAVNKNAQLQGCRGGIADACQRLKTMEWGNILCSFTSGGVSEFINFYLTRESMLGFPVIEEYVWLLKKAMVIAGQGCAVGTKVYRMLDWSASTLQDYQNRRSTVCLLAKFISTSQDIPTVRELSARRRCILLEITLVDFSEAWAQCLQSLNMRDDSGISYPVDISKNSARATENEVLFPPLYPIKIVAVEQGEREYVVRIETPAYVRLTSSRGMIQHHVEATLQLTQDRNLRSLSLCNCRSSQS